jgi:hypothetical protein
MLDNTNLNSIEYYLYIGVIFVLFSVTTDFLYNSRDKLLNKNYKHKLLIPILIIVVFSFIFYTKNKLFGVNHHSVE